ncbi:hypothetical protein NM208_g7474 [Fusarium decemcellulare]|uniref:Uncharacterized protein n=1 Tax=Fusarium decemcellulare TaxID=57161 RepID=A0ACC1S8Y0_9HYPO|nr:hypothetical protein NM208_g7474 [Fusarium decemcellulare]
MSSVVLDADQPAIPAEAVRGAPISLDALPALAELTHIARSSGAVGVGVASERAGCVAEAENRGGGEKDRLDLHLAYSERNGTSTRYELAFDLFVSKQKYLVLIFSSHPTVHSVYLQEEHVRSGCRSYVFKSPAYRSISYQAKG